MKTCVVCSNQFDTRECPVCKKRRDAEYRLKNIEKIKTYSKNHYIANAEKCNAQSQAYYAANTEKCRADMAAWRKANPDKAKANSALWKAANREKVNASSANKYAANPAKHNAACMAWQAANPEKVKENSANWRASNPGKCRVYVQNRRARKNGGKLSPGLTDKLFKLQRGKCACCHVSIEDGHHLDHVIPLALDGPNEDWNMQLLCGPCNLSKGAKHPVDFMRQRGFLL